jgi:hypothetical protein
MVLSAMAAAAQDGAGRAEFEVASVKPSPDGGVTSIQRPPAT